MINAEYYGRLLGHELKVALQSHFSQNQLQNDHVSSLFSEMREQGLTYEKKGKHQIFTSPVYQSDVSLEEVIHKGYAEVLFPVSQLNLSWKTFLVFRRRMKTHGESIDTVPMLAARFDEEGCFTAFSSHLAQGNENKVSLIFSSNDPKIRVEKFSPVFFKVRYCDDCVYFRIDATKERNTIDFVRVRATTIHSSTAPQALQRERL